MTRRLEQADWQQRALDHAVRVDRLTAGHLARREAGRNHPVEDFLFTYYRHRPAQLRRWHPGAGTVLLGAAAEERRAWRFYAATSEGVELDRTAFLASRAETVRFVHRLLSATASRPPQLGCFGLHEWAMVYRQPGEEVRHGRWPLRLGSAGTDEVVETAQLRCTHYDAFRFFTPSAQPRNSLAPRRDSQAALEQPGCLHAGMDLYKWAFKLAPAVPSELTADCFELARDVRVLDMRAAPYDLRELGYEPVAVETPEGKAEYARAQRGFAKRSAPLRRRLIEQCERLLGEA